MFVFTYSWLTSDEKHLRVIETSASILVTLQERKWPNEILLLLPLWLGNAIGDGRANGPFWPLWPLGQRQTPNWRISLFPIHPGSPVLFLHAHLDFAVLQYPDVRSHHLQFVEDEKDDQKGHFVQNSKRTVFKKLHLGKFHLSLLMNDPECNFSFRRVFPIKVQATRHSTAPIIPMPTVLTALTIPKSNWYSLPNYSSSWDFPGYPNAFT